MTIGVLIGLKTATFATLSSKDVLLGARTIALPTSEELDNIFTAIKETLDELIKWHHEKLGGIGVGFPCYFDKDTGKVQEGSPVHKAFAERSIEDNLHKIYEVPIAVSRNSVLAARLEHIIGLTEVSKWSVVILLGSNIDCAELRFFKDDRTTRAYHHRENTDEITCRVLTGGETEESCRLKDFIGDRVYSRFAPKHEQVSGERGFGLQQLIEATRQNEAAEKAYSDLCRTLIGFINNFTRVKQIQRTVVWAELDGDNEAQFMESLNFDPRYVRNFNSTRDNPFVVASRFDPFAIVRCAAVAAREKAVRAKIVSISGKQKVRP